MGRLIIGVNTLYRLLCFFKLFPMVSRHSIACLKAVTCALGPECLVPSVSQLSVLCDSSSTTYDPRPIDTGRVMLCSDLRTFAHDFAIYQHDCYSYEKVQWFHSHNSMFSFPFFVYCFVVSSSR